MVVEAPDNLPPLLAIRHTPMEVGGSYRRKPIDIPKRRRTDAVS